MLSILSPSKIIKANSLINNVPHSSTSFDTETLKIVELLRSYNIETLQDKLNSSAKLSYDAYDFYQQWNYGSSKNTSESNKGFSQAVFAFSGECYKSFDAKTLSLDDLNQAQKQIRIMSALYGSLRPLDLIQSYRLDLENKFEIGEYKNLYKFWGNKITENLNQNISKYKHKALVNLASNEYFKAVNSKLINVPIISPKFMDNKNGKYKVLSLYAKRSRGMMARFILENRIEDPEDIIAFDLDGYNYNNELSTELEPVFTRN